MRKEKLFVAMCCLLVCGYGCRGRRSADIRVPLVRIDTVEAYDRSRVLQFPGRVEAAAEVNMAFKVSGTLLAFPVEQGAFVRKGELVAELDPRDYRLQLDAVEAEYRSIEAEAGRVMALYADSVVTPDAYDKARYGLRQIRAKYENCKNQLADTKIYAPFDGYVQRYLFDPATVIGMGIPVLTFVSAGTPEVVINIPGSEYVRREDFVAFEAVFDFWPDRKIPLRLLGISPKANANQLYGLRLGIASDVRPQPSPGMNTMVHVICKPADGGQVCVPAAALFARDDKSYVWVYGPDGTIRSREVCVESLHTDGRAVIGSGVEVGEQIVTAGVHGLREGKKVAPIPAMSKTNVGGML